MKLFLYFIFCSLSISMASGAEPSTLERITLYKEEGDRLLSQGEYQEACKFLTVANDLAINQKISASGLDSIRIAKNKSCSLFKSQFDATSQADAIRRKRLCETYNQIISSCSIAGDIDRCVSIKSGGTSLQNMQWTCAFD
jgi:hypothetical protein